MSEETETRDLLVRQTAALERIERHFTFFLEMLRSGTERAGLLEKRVDTLERGLLEFIAERKV